MDIGHGVSIEFWQPDGEDEPFGIVETHPGMNGEPCGGLVSFEGHALMRSHPTWRVLSLDPLTLEPSILCRTCGHHGHIRNGRWERA